MARACLFGREAEAGEDRARVRSGYETQQGMGEAISCLCVPAGAFRSFWPDTATAMQILPIWIDDYNENHPHGGVQRRSPREFIQCQSQPAPRPV
jgi:hypothetical protein